MEDAMVTPEELRKAWAAGIDRLSETVAEAMNAAQPGRIIADSEELVRDANADFRQQAYEQALSLLRDKQKAFPPSGERTEEQG